MCGYVHQGTSGGMIDSTSPRKWVDCGKKTCSQSKSYEPPGKK